MPEGGRLTAHFQRLKEVASKERTTLGELFDNLSSDDHPLLIMLLSLPFVIPATPPGMSAIFGAVVIAASISMILAKPPWLPARFRNVVIKRKILTGVFEMGRRLAMRLERLVRPRLRVLTTSKTLRRIHGVTLVIGGFLLALPGPTFTNMPPAFLLIFLALGLIEEDGLLILVGYTALITALVLLIIFLPELIDAMVGVWNWCFGDAESE